MHSDSNQPSGFQREDDLDASTFSASSVVQADRAAASFSASLQDEARWFWRHIEAIGAALPEIPS